MTTSTPHFDPVVQELLTRLARSHRTTLAAGLAEHIRQEVPDYRGNPLVTPEDLEHSCLANLTCLLHKVADLPNQSLDPARATGARRAHQGVPFATMMMAYRVGMRYVWNRLLEAATDSETLHLQMAGANIWVVSDELASAASEAYGKARVERAQRDEELRSTLVAAMLDGDVGPESDWSPARNLDLRGTEYVVVAATTARPGTEALPGIRTLLAERNVQSAWRMTPTAQEGIVALRFGYGIAKLSADLQTLMECPAGLSAPFTNADHAHSAARQARLALATATPTTNHVMTYEAHSIATLLAGNPDGSAMIVSVLDPVLERAGADASGLLQTARAWFECGGSAAVTAERLHMHRNTVRARLQRLKEYTGLDPADPVAGATLWVALEAARISGLADTWT